MKKHNNFSVNLCKFNSEQHLTIDPTFDEPLLDAYSAVCGVINKQGKAKEVIKEFNEANPTFPVSEANFILHNWLTSYCNSMIDQEKKKKIANARAKGLALPPPKKNVQPPIQRRNAIYVDIESTSDMDDQDDMNNHNNMDYQDAIDEADEMFGHIQDFDTSVPVIKATKNVNQIKKGKIHSNYVSIESISDQDDMISHVQNPGLVTRNDYDIESTSQDDMDDFDILASIINTLSQSKKSDRSPMQDITNSENDNNTQDSDTSVSATNALLPLKSSRSSHSIKKPNINQDTLTPIIQNGIEDTLKQNDTIENNTQSAGTLNNTSKINKPNTLKQNKQNRIVKNNTQYASALNNTNKINTRTKNLQFFQNYNGIEDVSKQNSIVKNNTQGSGTSDSIGKKRKGE
ncbi:41599_t:CDS:10 [Gigaspora margarita]|uniref:41599_t:CDS:1 n=1 Tax=Gigaspora margarita TaxID=4874 RepID=A0ABM8W635_GIGMA|nr:41599_t:CDS:10 [Gigaspora margarita]